MNTATDTNHAGRPSRRRAARLHLALALGWLGLLANAAAAKPLKVYILAGQSNMQGHANVSTLDSLADYPATAPLLKDLRDADGKPVVCDQVWISSVGCKGNGWSDVIEQTGQLTAGWGASPKEIGPEWTFGLYTQKRLGEPILLIKTSWGGRSLHTDFRPPSAGPETINDFILTQWKNRKLDVDQETAKIRKNGGVFYGHMVAHVRKVLADIKRVVPTYDAQQGYELAGFVWFQGFNDLVDSWTYHDGYDQYGTLMAQFIRDVRKDLAAPKLPFVIGVLGVDGLKASAGTQAFRRAQASPAALPEFAGNVVAVETAPFWDDDLAALQARMQACWPKVDARVKAEKNTSWDNKMKAMAENFTPEEWQRLQRGVSNGGYHYLGAAKILAPIGKAFADALAALAPK